ncbi:MAG: hypothetical protein GC160_00460 [Acidobacteria bacterium]|nr:hypothetical protein [Acidobacteriota bacterium]
MRLTGAASALAVPFRCTLLGLALLGCAFGRPALIDSPVRVASWNLRRGLDSPSIRKGLATPLLSADCDILALQETSAAAEEAPVATLAAERGWSYTGNASNAILSRWPIRRAGRAVIGVNRTRELPWADIETPAGPLRIYSVHLSFRNGGWPFEEQLRFQEIAWILYHLERTEPPESPSAPVILAGDFNSIGWLLGGHQQEKGLRLLSSRGFLAAPGDGATHALFGRLDWILARGLRPVDGGVGKFSGSDHRWLWASFAQPQPEISAEPVAVTGVAKVWGAALAVFAAGALVWVGGLAVRQNRPSKPERNPGTRPFGAL